MKKLLLTLLLLLTPLQLLGQQLTRQYRFSTAAPDLGIDLRGTGIGYFQFIFYPDSTGVATCQVKLEKSADNSSWSDLIAATTCTANGFTAVTTQQVNNFVRLNATTKTGVGFVSVRLLGWITNPNASGTLSGDVTSNSLFLATETTLSSANTNLTSLVNSIQSRASRCILVSAASTNSTNCKNAAGNFMGIRMLNTTTTVYYLRLYNLTTAPTCSSATGFIESIPIPPAGAAGQVGGVVAIEPFEEAYSTGIGFCLTGGSSSTDNTNAAVGIFGTLLYN